MKSNDFEISYAIFVSVGPLDKNTDKDYQLNYQKVLPTDPPSGAHTQKT